MNKLELDQLNYEKIRRIFYLVNNCLANIAAYRVNWQIQEGERSIVIKNDFWVRANGALFDMAIIDWCKLFVEDKGKHHWSMIYQNRNEWIAGMLLHIRKSQEEYVDYIGDMKKYRDKYLAHLDNPVALNYPNTSTMLSSASYLYNFMRSDYSTKSCLGGIYDTAESFYEKKLADYQFEVQLRLKSL